MILQKKQLAILAFLTLLIAAGTSFGQNKFLVVAANKTSTAEKEINEAADQGYRFVGVSGGSTRFGGSEVTVLMEKMADSADTSSVKYSYKLLATRKTGTMQKELQEAGDAGYEYRGQTIFPTMFGGQEIVVIAEKNSQSPDRKIEYKLLATSKTSTLQKEMNEASEAGFRYLGVTTAATFMGGAEIVTVMGRFTTEVTP